MKTPPILTLALLLSACFAFAAQALSEVPVAFGPAEFTRSDSIVIEKVLSTSPALGIGERVVVRGRYTLASRDHAKLGLSLTRTESRDLVPISPAANQQITRGSGTFELAYDVRHIGCLNASLSDAGTGKAFARIYFGTPEQLARVNRSPRG